MLAWDFRRLVFDTQVLDVMRLSHVRRIVQKEAIELHFAGLRLEAELAISRRHDAIERMLLEIQLEEIHKRIQALTGQNPQALSKANASSSSTSSPLSVAALSPKAATSFR